MINLLGASISLQHLAIIVVAFAAIGLLQWFVGGTRLGRQMQATAQNPVARILGIPVERMVLLTFLLNAALAVVASLLISPIYLAKFSNGETIGLFAFIAAIVGGFNQVRGALVGGILIGVADARRRLHLDAVPAGRAAGAARRHHPGQAGRADGPQGGAPRMSAPAVQNSVAPRRARPDRCRAGRAHPRRRHPLVRAGRDGPLRHLCALALARHEHRRDGAEPHARLCRQSSLAQAAFMGLGAYTTAILTTKYGVSWYAAFALSGLLTFAVGLLLGFPLCVSDALPRLRHARLLDADLAALRNEQWLTGGVYGISNINRPDFSASSCSARWNSTASSSSSH
jgi:branched-subunit amino acid ABC-type transport system permease component